MSITKMKKILLCLIPFLFICCIKSPVAPSSKWTVLSELSEKNFLQNKMFFLDTLYLRYFLNNHTPVPEAQKVNRGRLQVWISTDQTIAEMKRNAKKDYFCFLGNKNGRVFKLLVEGGDYRQSDLYEGCIRFDSVAIQENDFIGICMITKDGTTILKGDTSRIMSLDTVVSKTSLWILKNQNPVETDSSFSLMWRNVYAMPGDFDVSKFIIRVKRVPASGDTTDRFGPTLFSSILGLTDNNGNANIGASSIFDVENRLLFIPPFIENGKLNNKPFANPALGIENANPDIYRKTQEMFDEIKKKYSIEYFERRL
jgi:hypothetical protein